jgi:hypothetical protein
MILTLLTNLFGCKQQSSQEKIRAEQKEGFSEISISSDDKHDVQLNLEKDSSLFLPVIRNYSEDNVFSNLVVNEPLGTDLGIFIAKIQKKPNGNIGIDYVMKQHCNKYQISEADVIAIARRNLPNAKLKVTGMGDKDNKDMLISIESELGLATSILADKGILQKFSEDIKSNKLSLGILNSSVLLITNPNSSFQKKFKSMAIEMDYNDVIHIKSGLYEWSNNTLIMKELYKYK